ncbi:hypothetical protein V1527DRAFT_312611 [Lipomyces starkeyi]
MTSSGRTLALAVLYFGNPEKDDIYREEMDQWEAAGVVSVKRPYSCKPEWSEGCARPALERARGGVSSLGSGGKGVCVRVPQYGRGVEESGQHSHGELNTEDDAKARFEDIRNVRYGMDMFEKGSRRMMVGFVNSSGAGTGHGLVCPLAASL